MQKHKTMSEFSVVRQVRARIIPEILSLRTRFAQLRGISNQAHQEPEPEAEPQPAEGQNRRGALFRTNALIAAKSLVAPIIDR